MVSLKVLHSKTVMQKKNLHSKIIFWIAICDFCIANIKCLILCSVHRYWCCFSRLYCRLVRGYTCTCNVQILPEIIIVSVWQLGHRWLKKNLTCNFLLGQFLHYFDKIAVIHNFFFFCYNFFTLLYQSLKQKQYFM